MGHISGILPASAYERIVIRVSPHAAQWRRVRGGLVGGQHHRPHAAQRRRVGGTVVLKCGCVWDLLWLKVLQSLFYLLSLGRQEWAETGSIIDEHEARARKGDDYVGSNSAAEI